MVRTGVSGKVLVVTIDRPERRNAVDGDTAQALADAFTAFEAEAEQRVAVLTGAGGNFCAGADLKAIAGGTGPRVGDATHGPMGPTRMRLSKPVIAAVEGYCVAGGLELALWCDFRVAARDAIFGVFNRRFGVPLIDGGTIRLARIAGQGLAMDMILTGRAVHADEAERFGLVNRLVRPGAALVEAVAVAEHIAAFPQAALRNDRLSLLEQWGMPEPEALANEHHHGLDTLASGEPVEGARRFAEGEGRGGRGA
jgi:enoyl-CoA hydratase